MFMYIYMFIKDSFSLLFLFVCTKRSVIPPKKLLGSGVLPPYTLFCSICTINSELKYFLILSRGWYPLNFSGRGWDLLDSEKLFVRFNKHSQRLRSFFSSFVERGVQSLTNTLFLYHIQSLFASEMCSKTYTHARTRARARTHTHTYTQIHTHTRTYTCYLCESGVLRISNVL